MYIRIRSARDVYSDVADCGSGDLVDFRRLVVREKGEGRR